MNYYGAKELAESFRTVRKNTTTIAEEIGEEHYGFRATPDTRSVAEMLTHISLASRLQEHVHGDLKLTTLGGFDFPGFMMPLMAEEKTARTKAQILDLLTANGARFAGWLEGLSDDFLGEHLSMPPGMQPASKTRFEMIMGVKEHEMHHRGQLMLIERLIGITPHLTRQMNARIAAMTAAQRP